MTMTRTQAPDNRSWAGAAARSGGRPTLSFFYSTTSGPSRRVEAFLAQVLQRRQNHWVFALQRINCEKHPELVERYAVTEVPTLVVVDGDRVLGRLEGYCGCREIEKLLEPWLNRKADRRPANKDKGRSSSAEAVVRSETDGALEEGSDHPALDLRVGAGRTMVGLSLPESLSFEDWHALGRRIGSITNASSWWLGDWALYGEGAYGKKYKQAIAVTGLDYQTLRNYAWVARRFDLSRRRDKLSFGHHAELAALPEQEQCVWLDRAESNRWSRNELRTHLREKSEARIPRSVEHVRLTVDTARLERWKGAAEAERLDLTDWLVAAADNAARSVDVSLPASKSAVVP